jgi:hypothetical protein
MPRTPSLRSLFLAWVCFSIAFSTVFLAFLTSFLVDSGYKKPIKNMDELFGSGMKLGYGALSSFFFDISDETQISNVIRNEANCPSPDVCLDWALSHKNVSLPMTDFAFQLFSTIGAFSGEKGEPLLCKVHDGVFFNTGVVMLMLYNDPLLKRVNEIFDRVVEAGLYNYWISQVVNDQGIRRQQLAAVNVLDDYYSFSLYHMQPAFYMFMMGLCLSVFCFVVELFSYRLLNKRR